MQNKKNLSYRGDWCLLRTTIYKRFKLFGSCDWASERCART